MKTQIIAEAGVNHNGSLELAKKLIDVAVEAKADYVKFQTFNTDRIVSHQAKKANYQQQNSSNNDDLQYNMIKNLELSKANHFELQAYCKNKNIGFLSTGFDEESVDFLSEMNIPFYKIPSGEITNFPLIRHIALKGKPVILSTGMSTLEEVNKAIDILTSNGIPKDDITLLHCNTEYPTPMCDVNLKAMLKLKEVFGVIVGYSDHTLGIEVPIAAVALGAKVIEKHFTLDRTMEGPDQAASLEPNELKAMIDAIRNIELAISGSGYKEPSASELKNRDIARKSIHILNPIKKGETIKGNDLIMKRPGDGISPMDIEQVIGKKANRDLYPDYKLTWEDI
jgi:N,N'-diacetyllegionaminate synthase